MTSNIDLKSCGLGNGKTRTLVIKALFFHKLIAAQFELLFSSVSCKLLWRCHHKIISYKKSINQRNDIILYVNFGRKVKLRHCPTSVVKIKITQQDGNAGNIKPFYEILCLPYLKLHINPICRVGNLIKINKAHI